MNTRRGVIINVAKSVNTEIEMLNLLIKLGTNFPINDNTNGSFVEEISSCVFFFQFHIVQKLLPLILLTAFDAALYTQ